MQAKIFTFIIILLFPLLLECQTASGIDRILAGLPKGTSVAVSVYSPAENRIMYEKNSLLSLKPASCVKLFTTGGICWLLGENYTVNTSIFLNTKKIINGILKDNLYLKGYGDIFLNYEDLENCIKILKAMGIKSIEGKIITDNSFFPSGKPTIKIADNFSPINIPAVSPLSFNAGVIETIVITNGNSISIKLSPEADFIKADNNLKLTGGKNKISIKLAESAGEYKVILNGTIGKNRIKKFFIYPEKPELMTALLLEEMLRKSGITVSANPSAGAVPSAYKEIIFSKRELKSFLTEANMNSSNLSAEILLSIFNAANKKDKSSNLKQFLERRGIETDGITLADGSGISSKNRLTVNAITSLLNSIYRNRNMYNTFYSTLSSAGINGTLKEMFGVSQLNGKFSGKSGYMAGVCSIAGFLKTSGGKDLIVAILINFKEKGIDYYREKEKEILELIYKEN